MFEHSEYIATWENGRLIMIDADGNIVYNRELDEESYWRIREYTAAVGGFIPPPRPVKRVIIAGKDEYGRDGLYVNSCFLPINTLNHLCNGAPIVLRDPLKSALLQCELVTTDPEDEETFIGTFRLTYYAKLALGEKWTPAN